MLISHDLIARAGAIPDADFVDQASIIIGGTHQRTRGDQLAGAGIARADHNAVRRAGSDVRIGSEGIIIAGSGQFGGARGRTGFAVDIDNQVGAVIGAGDMRPGIGAQTMGHARRGLIGRRHGAAPVIHDIGQAVGDAQAEVGAGEVSIILIGMRISPRPLHHHLIAHRRIGRADPGFHAETREDRIGRPEPAIQGTRKIIDAIEGQRAVADWITRIQRIGADEPGGGIDLKIVAHPIVISIEALIDLVMKDGFVATNEEIAHRHTHPIIVAGIIQADKAVGIGGVGTPERRGISVIKDPVGVIGIFLEIGQAIAIRIHHAQPKIEGPDQLGQIRRPRGGGWMHMHRQIFDELAQGTEHLGIRAELEPRFIGRRIRAAGQGPRLVI